LPGLPLTKTSTPALQFLRFRGKINIQRPKEPHYERARVIAVTHPKYPEPPKAKSCFKTREERTQQQLENPYNEIIAREVRNWLDHSRLVAVFHLNSITADEIFRVRVQLHKQNLHLKSYGSKIIGQAVKGTRYEAILPLFHSNHCIVLSPYQPNFYVESTSLSERIPILSEVQMGGKAKYKHQMMEKYLRDSSKAEAASQPGTQLNKWLESAAKFTPNRNNYHIEWNTSR